jgi:peroxiredoxin
VGVSADPQEANDRFRETLDLPFALVGDPGGAILKAYKVRWPLVGIAKRVTYVIGRDKTILKAFHSEVNMTAHAAQACEVVTRLER